MLVDLGDQSDPDTPAGERDTIDAVRLFPGAPVLALGGDNSITFAVAHGACADGLITLDAHHDLRDGRSNGSPVRRLVEAGLDGRRVVQVGISDFANSAALRRARPGARDHRDQPRGARAPADRRRDGRGAGDRRERSDRRASTWTSTSTCATAPWPRRAPRPCPAGSAPASCAPPRGRPARDPRVVSLDITEVDATADTPDGRTVRLAALCVLEIATGVLLRADERD